VAVSSAPAELSFEKTVELADAREAIWHSWRRTKLSAMVGVSIVGSLVFALIVSLIPDGPPFWALFIPGLVFYGLLVVWLNWVFIGRTVQRQVERAAAVGSERWLVNDDGIKIQSSEGELQLNWTALRGYMMTKGLIIVRLARSAIAMPKRCLSQDQHVALLQFFQYKNVPLLKSLKRFA
jgi:hypothetical protein